MVKFGERERERERERNSEERFCAAKKAHKNLGY